MTLAAPKVLALPPLPPPLTFPDTAGGIIYADMSPGDQVEMHVDRATQPTQSRSKPYGESKVARHPGLARTRGSVTVRPQGWRTSRTADARALRRAVTLQRADARLDILRPLSLTLPARWNSRANVRNSSLRRTSAIRATADTGRRSTSDRSWPTADVRVDRVDLRLAVPQSPETAVDESGRVSLD